MKKGLLIIRCEVCGWISFSRPCISCLKIKEAKEKEEREGMYAE